MVRSQSASSILDEAAAAIGGWTALQSIKCVHLEADGQDWEPWQAYDVGGTVDVSTFRIATDLDLGSRVSRVEMDADVVYPWPHRVAYVEITDAEAGMLADLSLGAVAIERLHPSLYATARRDFVAFVPEALRLARADADAAVGGPPNQFASDTMMPIGAQRSPSPMMVRRRASPMPITIRHRVTSRTASNGLIGGR